MKFKIKDDFLIDGRTKIKRKIRWGCWIASIGIALASYAHVKSSQHPTVESGLVWSADREQPKSWGYTGDYARAKNGSFLYKIIYGNYESVSEKEGNGIEAVFINWDSDDKIDEIGISKEGYVAGFRHRREKHYNQKKELFDYADRMLAEKRGLFRDIKKWYHNHPLAITGWPIRN